MSLPEISRRCLSCGAAVRAGGRFCPQCGNLMEAEAPGEVAGADEGARTDEGDAPVGTPPAEDAAPAAAGEIRLEESWKDWEESVGAHTDAARFETPAREQSREEVSGESPEVVGGESRGAAGETTPAPPTQPLLRPHSTPPAPSVVQREGHDDGRGDEGAASAASAGVGGSLARPRSGEKGRRAAAVKESLRPRVERVRDASMGVLDNAAEDSGLRFVLIAIVLFAVFLVFLFINNLVR